MAENNGNDKTRGKDVTRRTFTTAAAVAVASTPNRAPAFQRVMAANSQVQYGFIGTGSRGQYLLTHLKNTNNLGRCVAVCDIWEPNLKKGADVAGTTPEQYKDYREMLGRKELDCVLVATPLFEHFRVTRDALLAGKHVFCEKSLVFKPEEVHALRALSNDRPKQILQVGLQRRYSKFYQTAKQMIDKGMLGDVTHVHAQWHRTMSGAWKIKPDPNPQRQRMANWRLYREYSGGLTAELASHQIDVADWMFGASPEFVVGVGGNDFIRDGRDVYDNIQLIYKYPKGQKLLYSSISTNEHLPLFGASRTQFGERIMGTKATIEITVGTDNEPALGMWYREPVPPSATPAGAKKEAVVANASLASTGKGQRGLPILFDRDQISGNESFLDKEMKFARRWLYSKGVMVPEEDRNPVDIELENFLESVRTGKRPLADLEVGLADSTAVMLSNLAMDEGRRVYFSEIDKLGKAPKKA